MRNRPKIIEKKRLFLPFLHLKYDLMKKAP